MEDICPFCWATETPVLDIWWDWPQGGSITCMLSHLYTIPQIHLWCNTCQSLDSKYGSRAFWTYILTDASISICGGAKAGIWTHDQVCHSTVLSTIWPFGSALTTVILMFKTPQNFSCYVVLVIFENNSTNMTLTYFSWWEGY